MWALSILTVGLIGFTKNYPFVIPRALLGPRNLLFLALFTNTGPHAAGAPLGAPHYLPRALRRAAPNVRTIAISRAQLQPHHRFAFGFMNRVALVRRRRAFDYCLKINAGPLTRSAIRCTVTSTRSAIFMNGIPLFIP